MGKTRASKSTLGISRSMLDAEDSSDDSIGLENVLAEDSFHEEARSGEKGVEETGMMIQQEDLENYPTKRPRSETRNDSIIDSSTISNNHHHSQPYPEACKIWATLAS